MENSAQSVRLGTSAYGHELVLDLHSCNTARFNRASIDQFFTELCGLIDMEKCEVHFWDDIGVPQKSSKRYRTQKAHRRCASF